MSTTTPPTAIDLRSLAQKDETLSGRAPLSAFARLSEGLPEFAAALAPVAWSARAQWRQPLGTLAVEAASAVMAEPQLWLQLQVSAEVPQTCQRCLSPYVQAVEVDRWFRFVATEAIALAEDDDSEEDLLVLEPRFDLLALVEDELLMELPLVPMHDECPEAPRMSTGELPESEPQDKPNPFAALAALKARSGKT
ncbi:MAG: hypothetical protein RJA36_3777 [Pseudomonadota bacterium]|jgi:uncharacterized protein